MAGTTTWARWAWSNGLGRWHRLFTDGDLTKTACGSRRAGPKHVAKQTSTTPTSGPICKVCKDLDDLLQKVMTGKLTDAVAGKESTITLPATEVKELVPTGAAAKPEPPEGICTCGCDQSDEARAYKAAVADWEASERARKQAEFEAFLAKRTAGSAA